MRRCGAVRCGAVRCLSSLTEKTKRSSLLQLSLQRQNFFIGYLKVLSVGPPWFELTTSARLSDAQSTEPSYTVFVAFDLMLGTTRLLLILALLFATDGYR